MISVLPSFLTLPPEALDVSIQYDGAPLYDGAEIKGWHQGMDLHLEIGIKFDQAAVIDLVGIKGKPLLVISGYSSLTKTSQSEFYEFVDSDCWADFDLDGSKLGGELTIRVELFPMPNSKRLSELSPTSFNAFVAREIRLPLEGGGNRIQIESIPFSGSLSLPKTALWRIESEFPQDVAESVDYELNSALWVTINSLREPELNESIIGRQCLKADFIERLIEESLKLEGLVDRAIEGHTASPGTQGSLLDSVRSVFRSCFESSDEGSMRLEWETRRSDVSARIQGMVTK